MMNYNVIGLISLWKERLKLIPNEQPYKDALGECILELEDLLNTTLQEEAAAWEREHPDFAASLPSEEVLSYLQDMEADNYLSSMEAHEACDVA